MASIDQILICRQRWLDAVSSRQPAAALVEDIFSGCRDAVDCLGRQLTDLGYPAIAILLPSPANLDERVARIETQTGVPVPKILHAFWRIVGGISLIDLKSYKHVAFWDNLSIDGAHQFCDGVHIDTCDDDWFAYTAEDFSDYSQDDDAQSFLYSFAPDGYHKDDISGGPPYALGHGSDWSPPLENFNWSGYRRPDTAVPDSTDFVSYLRTAILECAGFPGLLGHPRFEEIRQNIVQKLNVF